MLRRVSLTTASILAVIGLASCAPGTNGPTETEPSASEPAAPTSGTDESSKIDNPKSLKSITDACQLLTPEQLTELGAVNSKTPEPGTTAYGGPTCSWSNDNFSTQLSVDAKTGTGAEDIIELGKTEGQQSTVDGYPAARMHPESSLCRVEIAVSDSESFNINYTKYSGKDPAMQDPCGYAEKIASEILKNLPNA